MSLLTKLGKTELHVVNGDITRIPTDAIITAINSAGAWFGGVDGAIRRAAGNKYHFQALNKMPLSDGDVIVAKGDREDHNGEFDNVVFVVDDFVKSVNNIVYAGLNAVHDAGYNSVAIPAIRMGVMAGAVEKTPADTVSGLSLGIRTFLEEYSFKTSLEKMTFVVYNDVRTQRFLESGFTKIAENN